MPYALTHRAVTPQSESKLGDSADDSGCSSEDCADRGGLAEEDGAFHDDDGACEYPSDMLSVKAFIQC